MPTLKLRDDLAKDAQVARLAELLGVQTFAVVAALKTVLAERLSDHPGFEEFWRVYPRKEGKLAARKAWNKLRPSGGLLAKVLHGLARWVASRQWRVDGVVPHASTWLNGQRWEDEVDDRQALAGTARLVGPPGKYAAFGPGGQGLPPGLTG